MNIVTMIAIVVIASATSLFAQTAKKADEKCKFLECPLGTRTATERSEYKEAAKEVKQLEKQVQKQESYTEKACAPTIGNTVNTLLNNPSEAGRDLSDNRAIGSSKCDRESGKLDALKSQEAEAERVAKQKKAEYDAAKQRTGSWR